MSSAGGKLVAMKGNFRKEEDILSIMSHNLELGYDEPLLTDDAAKWRQEMS